MGNICEKPAPFIDYRSGMRELQSAISQNQNEEEAEALELITLTSQNTESSYIFDDSPPIKQSRVHSHQKTIDDFQMVRILGKGAFGQVLLVRDKHSSKFYAMKIINKDTIKNHQQKINALSERYLLEALENHFLVKLHYAFQSKSKLYLLVDFMSGGELFYLLRSKRVFEEQVAVFYAAQILLALEYLHSRNIIYRDLKPENILLTKQGHIKLADFGLSKICFSRNQLAYSICGTPEYMAPEIILGKGYDKSADWFSFGSLIYDMLTGKPPFYSKNKHQILNNITSKEVPLPQNLSANATSLLQGLFKIKPKQRLGYHSGAEEIKSHPFFSSIDFEQLKALKVKPPIEFESYEINNEGFEENGIEGDLNIEHNISSQGKVHEDALFKDFTYFKQETYSYSNDEDGRDRLSTNKLLGPLISSELLGSVSIKK